MRHVSKYVDATRSQNSPDHGNTLFHSNMLALDDASNFIEHFNCAFIVGDKQRLQNFVEIINPSSPRASLQCRVASNFVYEIVDDVTHATLPFYAEAYGGQKGQSQSPTPLLATFS